MPVAAPADDAVLDGATTRAADEILAPYQKVPANAASAARKGCWLWFIFALAMFALCVVSLYLIYGTSK
jgi:hypothetical protein